MRRTVSLMIVVLFVAALVVATAMYDNGGSEISPNEYLANVPPVEDLTSMDTSRILGLEDGVLTVGMECAYAPYNWTQTDDSNGAVPIANMPGSYANGYDVMIAKRICETRKELGRFRSLEDLKKVKGIGEGTYEELKDYVVIE